MDRLLQGAPALRGRGLDLGCGTGFSTEVLVAKCPDVAWEGADASASMLAVARRKSCLQGVGFREAKAEALPYADASFDVVVASFAWHWFAEQAGQEVRRVLRPGGWLLASVPVRRRSSASGNRLLARALLSGRRRFRKRTSQGLSPDALARLLTPPVWVARHEVLVERECFADERRMMEALTSRGALVALFGDHPPTALDASGPIEYEWPYGVLHVQTR